MSGEHFSAGTMPHRAERFLPDDVYTTVERDVVYGCVDVTVRNPDTGEVFLWPRSEEPQLGLWFAGGRIDYDTSLQANAARQVKRDLNLEIPGARFEHIATYSTPFPVAGPKAEQQDHGRHTVNAVMVADLTPAGLSAINQKLTEWQASGEHPGAGTAQLK